MCQTTTGKIQYILAVIEVLKQSEVGMNELELDVLMPGGNERLCKRAPEIRRAGVTPKHQGQRDLILSGGRADGCAWRHANNQDSDQY